MNFKSKRGVIPVVVLYVVGGLALTQLVPNWRVGNLFAKGPQTKQLAEAQADLVKAKATAAEAKLAYEAALVDERAKTTTQLRYSQQFAYPLPELLMKAPQTPEVKLARSFALRVNSSLVLAIGDLPADKRAEVLQVIQDAVSDKQAEVDAANEKLAEMDAQLKITTEEKAVLAAQLPVLQQAKAAADVKVLAKDAEVVTATAKVAAYADKAAAKEKEAGSLGALVVKLLWVIGIIGALYIFAHFMLPSLAQEFPAVAWLGKLNKTVKSVSSSHA